MKRSFRVAGLAGAVLVGAILLFQNCSQPMQQFDPKDTYASSLAFSYETEMDTLAYMSCAGQQATPSIWTLKLAALGPNSGVRLSPEFFTATSKFSDSDKAKLLNQSGINAGSVIQVALREIDSVQQVMTESAGAPSFGKDIFNLLEPLNSSTISPILIASQYNRTNYIGVLGAQGRMEAALRFTTSESLAQDLRNNLSAKARLMVTYKTNDTSPAYLVRGSTAYSMTSGYGRSIQLQFTYPLGDSPSGPRVLGAALESNLTNGTFVANWICSADMQLRIGRSTTDCPAIPDNDPGNLGSPARLAMVRRVLPVSNWYVNLPNNCVLQKPATECYSTMETGNHYVSICNRNL